MFYFPGILRILKDYNKDISNVKKFLNSYSFYCQLCLLDSSLPKYGNVYLLINKEKKKCKVGMSFDIEQRYSKTKIENELSYIVPVYNMKSTETKILKRFRVMFGIPVDGNETFSYTNYETATKEFLSIAKENDVDSTNFKVPQHITKRRFVSKMSDIWLSFLATKVLFSYYIEEPESRNNAMEFLKLIELDLKEDSYAFNQHNNALDTDVRYILFHKYTLIFNVKDEYVSGSHLYNSICRADGKKKKYRRFKPFIDSDRFKARIKQFKEARSDLEPYYWSENKKQKYLEGYYIHYSLVHFVIEELNANYAIQMSMLIFKIMIGEIKLQLPKDKGIDSILSHIKGGYNDTVDVKTIYDASEFTPMKEAVIVCTKFKPLMTGVEHIPLSFARTMDLSDYHLHLPASGYQEFKDAAKLTLYTIPFDNYYNIENKTSGRVSVREYTKEMEKYEVTYKPIFYKTVRMKVEIPNL